MANRIIDVRKNIFRPRVINTLDISHSSTIIECVDNRYLADTRN